VIDTALRSHLAAGVTTVRDLGDRRWSVLERRDRANDDAADVAIPTILASGPPITSIRGHCWQMGGEAQGAVALRAAIRERAERRVDVVKIMSSGGVTTAGTDLPACQFPHDEVALLVDEAHAAGLPVTVHAHGLAAIEQAIEAGVDGIEHCACLTPSGMDMRDSLLEFLAQRRIAVCPAAPRGL
jgi:imidazolonepropionase-like amidohydrolase